MGEVVEAGEGAWVAVAEDLAHPSVCLFMEREGPLDVADCLIANGKVA